MEEQVIRHINDRASSVEIGTPSKNGAVKIYFDAGNPEEARKLVDNALAIRRYAAAQHEQEGKP